MKDLIQAHGGLILTVLAIFYSVQAILSAARTVIMKWESPEQQAADTKLTFLNKASDILGKVIDFLQGNVAH